MKGKDTPRSATPSPWGGGGGGGRKRISIGSTITFVWKAREERGSSLLKVARNPAEKIKFRPSCKQKSEKKLHFLCRNEMLQLLRCDVHLRLEMVRHETKFEWADFPNCGGGTPMKSNSETCCGQSGQHVLVSRRLYNYARKLRTGELGKTTFGHLYISSLKSLAIMVVSMTE